MTILESLPVETVCKLAEKIREKKPLTESEGGLVEAIMEKMERNERLSQEERIVFAALIEATSVRIVSSLEILRDLIQLLIKHSPNEQLREELEKLKEKLE